jgi:hypothetical protein
MGLVHVKVSSMFLRVLRWHSLEKLKRKAHSVDSFLEFRPIRTVPGNDGIKSPQAIQQTRRRYYALKTKQVYACGCQ